MHSFQWKKKITKRKNGLAAFSNGENEEEDLDSSVDWLTATKRPKLLLLEDGKAKSKRLQDEGITLAEDDRFWEAISKWNLALTYSPEDHKLHDMVSQGYAQVGELYPALNSAKRSTQICPEWWPGHQTLGRALLGLGEVHMAVHSFSRAIMLQPDVMELWDLDFKWALTLLLKHKELEEKALLKIAEDEDENFALEEITDDASDENKKEETQISSTISTKNDVLIRNIDSSDICACYGSNSSYKDPIKDSFRSCCSKASLIQFCNNCGKKIKRDEAERLNKLDSRFHRPVALLSEESGETLVSSRGDINKRKMVCYRK